jgi:hypothetical protein
VIRAGAIALALAVAASWHTHVSPWFRVTAIVLLVLGLVLLIVDREPWPHCCEHCPPRRGHPEQEDRDHPAAGPEAGALDL